MKSYEITNKFNFDYLLLISKVKITSTQKWRETTGPRSGDFEFGIVDRYSELRNISQYRMYITTYHHFYAEV